jgi:hypothetical protein
MILPDKEAGSYVCYRTDGPEWLSYFNPKPFKFSRSAPWTLKVKVKVKE